MDYYTLKTKKTPQKIKTLFDCSAGLNSDNILSLCFSSDGALYAGTAGGLSVYRSDCFETVQGITGEVCAIENGKGKIMFAAVDNIVYTVDGDSVVKQQVLEDNAVGIEKDDAGNIWLITKGYIYRYDGAEFILKCDVDFADTKALTACGNSEVFAACPNALMMLHGKRPRWSTMMRGISGVPDSRINTLASDSFGHVWVGCDDGLYLYDGRSEWLTPQQVNSFPACAVTYIVLGKDSVLYVGTEIGLYIINGYTSSFLGKSRYIADDRVACIAVSQDNNEIWVGTAKGLTRIEYKPMYLSEKADYYESVMHCFDREGYMLSRRDTDGTDMESGCVSISDNDGLWTGTYVAAESLRYAATGDSVALENARRSMKALLKLMTMTGVEGFPARAYRRPGEDKFGDGDIEWHKSSDEKGELEWKGETSSDELVGHFYASSWYYDLCADDNEKKEIAEAIGKISNHILSHDYTLCDADGLPTTWAHFSPYELNHDDRWCWEKGINSLELLSFLRITYHMTGEMKYLDYYNEMIKKYHYAMNTILYKIPDCHTSHIDDKLGFYIMIPLLRYEDNEELLRYYRLALRHHYEYEKCEHCPLYSFVFAIFTGAHAELDEAVSVLEDFPLDLRRYNVKNSIRPDIEIDTATAEFGSEKQAKYALPVDERPIGKLCYNSFRLDAYGSEDSFEVPSTWLHPYWFAKYFGLITE